MSDYTPLPDDMFSIKDEAFWTIPFLTGGDGFVVTHQMATAMSDQALQESLDTLQTVQTYRQTASRTTPPEGYYVVLEGASKDGDLRLNQTHDPASWESAEGGFPYWTFDLLIRPEKQ